MKPCSISLFPVVSLKENFSLESINVLLILFVAIVILLTLFLFLELNSVSYVPKIVFILDNFSKVYLGVIIDVGI